MEDKEIKPKACIVSTSGFATIITAAIKGVSNKKQ